MSMIDAHSRSGYFLRQIQILQARGKAAMTRILSVWWDGRCVVQLTQIQDGELGFIHAPEWFGNDQARPLSASLLTRAKLSNRRT
jgi:hypothetical protein